MNAKWMLLAMLLATALLAGCANRTLTGVVVDRIDDDEYRMRTDDGRTVRLESEGRRLPIGPKIEVRGRWDDREEREFTVKSFEVIGRPRPHRAGPRP